MAKGSNKTAIEGQKTFKIACKCSVDIVGVSWKINGIFLLFIFLSKFPIWGECRSVKFYPSRDLF